MSTIILTILNIILWICGIVGIIVLVLAVAAWLVRKFGGSEIHVKVYDGEPEDGNYVGDAIITVDENGNPSIRMKEDDEQNKD